MAAHQLLAEHLDEPGGFAVSQERSRMTITPTQASVRRREARLRHQAASFGQGIWKVHADSRWWLEYGPYAVIDLGTDALVEWGLDLDSLEQKYPQA